MGKPPRVVAITGASGYIGARLIQELRPQPYLGKLVAFDLNPLTLCQGAVCHRPSPGESSLAPRWPTEIPLYPPLQRGDGEISGGLQGGSAPQVITYQQDLTTPIDDALRRHQVNTLVHLAHIIRPGRSRSEIIRIRQTNLKMLRTVLKSCAQAGVQHIIYLSSHTVYGPHKDNPIPLTEGAPLHPLPGFPYGYDKFLAEQCLRDFSQEHQDTKVNILRSCVVLGPGADNYITRAFFRPLLLVIKGYNPPLQFLHQDDLARILTIIIRKGVPGVFNVAGEGSVHYREVVKTVRGKLVSLPDFLAYPLVELTWRLGLQHDAPSAGLDFIRYPIVVSTESLKKAAHYQFQYTSLEALMAFAEARAQHPVRRKVGPPAKL